MLKNFVYLTKPVFSLLNQLLFLCNQYLGQHTRFKYLSHKHEIIPLTPMLADQ